MTNFNGSILLKSALMYSLFYYGESENKGSGREGGAGPGQTGDRCFFITWWLKNDNPSIQV